MIKIEVTNEYIVEGFIVHTDFDVPSSILPKLKLMKGVEYLFSKSRYCQIILVGTLFKWTEVAMRVREFLEEVEKNPDISLYKNVSPSNPASSLDWFYGNVISSLDSEKGLKNDNREDSDE